MHVSTFKARCTAVLRETERTGEAVLITRRGRPVARLEPIQPRLTDQRLLGTHAGQMAIRSDFVDASSQSDWDMLD